MIKKILLILIVGMFLLNCVSAEHSMPSDLVDDDTSLLEGAGTWANNVTEGIFWTLMLLGFCIVLFMATVRYNNARAFAYAGTTGLFGAILLGIIGWIPWSYASIFIIVGASSLAWMAKGK